MSSINKHTNKYIQCILHERITLITFFLYKLHWDNQIINKLLFSESESENLSVMSDSLQPHGLYHPWNSPSQNTGVGSLSLLQEIFKTQGLNRGLLHCRQILYQLSYQGSSCPIHSINVYILTLFGFSLLVSVNANQVSPKKF